MNVALKESALSRLVRSRYCPDWPRGIGRVLLTMAAAMVLLAPVCAQQKQRAGQYTVELASAKPHTGEQDLDLVVTDAAGKPVAGLTGSASLSMPAMAAMSLEPPKLMQGPQAGHYTVHLNLPHDGKYELDLSLSMSGMAPVKARFNLDAGGGMESMQGMPGMKGMPGMEGMQMKGALGDWPANREGSATSWQPDSSPMFMAMLPKAGRLDLGIMGTLQGGYVNDGGKRGYSQLFTDSMFMLMGREETGGGTLGFELMSSLDPLINGKRGVPDLFQTGETANGVPLVDRQHPHNFFSEIAASYSHPIARDMGAFLYAAPVGEPALGGVMFMHRPSGMEVPEAPISHHWFDSTHISFGVVTGGLTVGDKLNLEGSAFNGHEPGENRYALGPVSLNSASGRITYNPSPEWSLSTSYGYLNSPEALSPGVSEHRLTFDVAYSHNFANGDNLSATAYLGQNIIAGLPRSNGWLAEATLYHRADSIFARYERVDKDELFNVPPGNYTINKLVLGDVHNFYSHDQLDYGIGAYLGVYSFPSSLKPFYGNPVTWGVFLRVRPARME